MRGIFVFIFLSVFFLYFHLSFSLTCTIRSGNCLTNELCIFSIYSTENSHVGACGYYSYNLCCDQIFSYINRTCNSSTSPILSLFQINNTHVAQPNYYTFQLCAGYSTYPLECSIRSSCYEDETCLVSLYSSVNSHVAHCNYYQNKLCCKQLSDLLVNSSSLKVPTKPLHGSNITINITVWNVGDVNAYNVNVSCYEDGILFDSKLISFIPKKSYVETYCNWTVSCRRNISVFVDPLNQIRELNETNNEAYTLVDITEKLNITINFPLNNSQFYRGERVWLNSTVVSSCSNSPPHTTYWYNESTLIGIGDSIQWQIPLDDTLLGRKNITAFTNHSGYISSSSSIFITILNNPPSATVSTNPTEIESGNRIEITCSAFDLEDCPSQASCNILANISILDANGNWNNASATRIGNTFYREYIAPYYPLGEYRAYCSVVDSDGGYFENYTKFLVWQNASVFINLDSSYYMWGEKVRIFGSIIRKDGSKVQNSPVDIFLENQKVCSNNTDMNGYYTCEFMTPNQIGNFKVIVNSTDIFTGKIFANSTILVVKFVYGGREQEMGKAPSVSCYEVPQIVVNPDGSIKRVYVRVCVW